MASQKDVQDLLRLLTTGRNKLSMLAAMGRVKALQAASLGSINALATANLAAVEAAIGGDAKSAKQLQTAAKSSAKNGGPPAKRSAGDAGGAAAKRKKTAYELEDEPQTPAELEAALALPDLATDEEALAATVLLTNRAPLVLAFAVASLKYTMPEQPPSSRLSLAQAVVGMNSQARAANLGISSGPTAEQEGWGAGQPKVRILNRDVYVLKRGGYEWAANHTTDGKEEKRMAGEREAGDASQEAQTECKWHVSQSITSRESTFVARCIDIDSPAQARSILARLTTTHFPVLAGASHNMSAWRCTLATGGTVEDSTSDGEAGGGPHVLRLLQAADLSNVLVVVSRWYGGVLLGPDRWRIITYVVHDALAQRRRIPSSLDAHQPLWGLDLSALRAQNTVLATGRGGTLPIHQPAAARDYLLKSFGTAAVDAEPAGSSKKKKPVAAQRQEREDNLGRLLGALDLLFASWAPHLAVAELDRRAWAWYVRVRPSVEDGVKGWGAKGAVQLREILALRRTECALVGAEDKEARTQAVASPAPSVATTAAVDELVPHQEADAAGPDVAA